MRGGSRRGDLIRIPDVRPIQVGVVSWNGIVMVGSSVGFSVFVIVLTVLAVGALCIGFISGAGASGATAGMARPRQVRRAAGPRLLLRRAKILRPSFRDARPNDLGYCLGRASGVEC